MATALITGASAGIGMEMAKLAAADGYDVVLVARREERLREIADEITSKYDVAAHVEATDLSNRDERTGLVTSLGEAGIEIDVLVNNAGLGSNGPFHELDRDRELLQIQVNMEALTDLTRLFLPGMVERGSGHVLNIASTAGFQPGPYMATYYATKAYVISFSEALWYELKDSGVTVTAHCPGATESEFAEKAGNDDTLLFEKGSVASSEEVARHAWRSMKRGERVAVHGVMNWLGTLTAPVTPQRVVLWLTSRINR